MAYYLHKLNIQHYKGNRTYENYPNNNHFHNFLCKNRLKWKYRAYFGKDRKVLVLLYYNICLLPEELNLNLNMRILIHLKHMGFDNLCIYIMQCMKDILPMMLSIKNKFIKEH